MDAVSAAAAPDTISADAFHSATPDAVAPETISADTFNAAPDMPSKADHSKGAGHEIGNDVISGDAFNAAPDDAETYGTTGQKVKTFLEGAGRGAVGPLAPWLEKKAGISEQAIKSRQAINPVTAGAGEAAGLLGGALTGTGEAALMEAAGKGAAHLVGLAEPVSYAAKIGSSAVKSAAEMAVLQSGDEVSKRVLHDPEQSSQSALANIGLGAALGGATGAFVTGAVSPLWKATVGPRAEAGFKALVSMYGGLEGGAATSIEQDIANSGVALPPELTAVAKDMPGAKEKHSFLSQNDTEIAGRKYQETLANTHQELEHEAIRALGVEPEHVQSLPDLDKYTTGRSIGESLEKELKNQHVEPVVAQYKKFEPLFKDAPLTTADKQLVADEISQKILKDEWHKNPDPSSLELAHTVMEKISSYDNANDLKKLNTFLRESHPWGKETFHAAKELRNTIDSAFDKVISRHITEGMNFPPETAAKVLQEYKGTKAQYKSLMDKLDNLNEHLHVGKYEGPQQFMSNLREMYTTNGEGVLSRLSGANKADTLAVLQAFPETLQQVKQYNINKLLDSAVTRTESGYKLNINTLTKHLDDKLSPQVKNLILSPEQLEKIKAIDRVAKSLHDADHNWSNTARTAAKLGHGTPSPLSLIAALMGHAGVGALSYLGKLGFDEGRAALKLATLKFLGSDQPVKIEGFKAMAQFLQNAVNGQNAMVKATAAVLKPGAQVLAASAIPSAKDNEKLDKAIDKFSENPSKLDMLRNSHVGHYMPEHQTFLTQATINQVRYLSQLKPREVQPSLLDSSYPPTAQQEARYDRALTIANNPNTVLDKIKSGTLLATDKQDLQALYPAVYTQMVKELSSQMAELKQEGRNVPYATRVSLSLFLGQPVDSTMNFAAIQAAQPKPQQQPQQPGKPMKGRQGKSAINKLSSSYKTPSQAAESDRANRE